MKNFWKEKTRWKKFQVGEKNPSSYKKVGKNLKYPKKSQKFKTGLKKFWNEKIRRKNFKWPKKILVVTK